MIIGAPNKNCTERGELFPRDWNKAIADGMKVAGLQYSGQFGWAETTMYWKVNHMVVPKNQALKCNECHGEKGRLDWKALRYTGDPQKVKK